MRLAVFLISTILLLAVSAFAACPSQESVYPCTCTDEEGYVDLLCYGKSITLDHVKTALSALDRKDSVIILLDEMNLGTIPSDFFQGFNIQKLEISHCQLDSLSGGGGKPLTGLEDTLEELEIMTSFTEDNGLTKLDLGHLRKLKEMDLSYNAITEVSDDWFAGGPASLTSIMFSNNNIEKLGDKAFAEVKNLNVFHFHGNRFGHLKRSMLPNPASKLEEIELDNNALTSLPEDLFTDMPALKQLSLRTNGLTRIPEKIFRPIFDHLKIFDIRGNPIICDSQLDWISKLDNNIYIIGRCEAPKEERGTELADFIRGRK